MSFRLGNTIVLVAEPDEPCTECGKMAELRPYGPNGERVCYDCGMKNPALVEQHMERLFKTRHDGKITIRLCPKCGQHLDQVSGVNAASQPEAGNLTMCAYCCTILQFTADLSLEIASAEVVEEFRRAQPEIWAELQQIKKAVQQGALDMKIGRPKQDPTRKH